MLLRMVREIKVSGGLVWICPCQTSLHLGRSKSCKILEQKFIFQISTLNHFGLTLKTSALKLFTLANLRYQLSWSSLITLLYAPTDTAPQFLLKVTPLDQWIVNSTYLLWRKGLPHFCLLVLTLPSKSQLYCFHLHNPELPKRTTYKKGNLQPLI